VLVLELLSQQGQQIDRAQVGEPEANTAKLAALRPMYVHDCVLDCAENMASTLEQNLAGHSECHRPSRPCEELCL
jgi:hypothetical protein